MPPLTSKPWFGPKRFGWGWNPVSWEGWLVTVVFIAGIVVSGFFLSSSVRVVVIVVLIVALLAISYVTGGAPGTTWGRRS